MRIPQSPPVFSDLLAEHAPGLAAAVNRPSLTTLVRECLHRGRHWDKIRFVAREMGEDPGLVWLLVKMSRSGFLQTTGLSSATGQPQVLNMPASTDRAMMLIDQQLRGDDPFRRHGVMRPDLQPRLAAESRMDEAIDSSILEGASTKVSEAREMLRQRRPPRDASERMIVNNFEAMRFVRDHRGHALTPDLLREVQAILTRDTLPAQQVGAFRTTSDTVAVVDPFGAVLHQPPSAEALASRLSDLCRFANEEENPVEFIHPVVRAVLLHFQIAYEHPFCDGNGRTARAVFYWYLLKKGFRLFEFLPISSVIRRSPARYARAFLLTETDDFDATYFVRYHIRVIDLAREAMWRHVRNRRAELRRSQQLFVHEVGLNARQQAVLMEALRDPEMVFTIKSHQRSFGVAFATARSDLLDLEQRRYFRKVRSGNRFEFHPVVEQLNRRASSTGR